MGMTFPRSKVTSPRSQTCFSGRAPLLSELGQDSSITSLHFGFPTCERGITLLTCRVIVKSSDKVCNVISTLSGKQLAPSKWLLSFSLVNRPAGEMKVLCCSFDYFSGPLQIPSPFFITQPLFLRVLTPPQAHSRLLTGGPTYPWRMSTCAGVCAKTPERTWPLTLTPHLFYSGENPLLDHCVEGKIHIKF